MSIVLFQLVHTPLGFVGVGTEAPLARFPRRHGIKWRGPRMLWIRMGRSEERTRTGWAKPCRWKYLGTDFRRQRVVFGGTEGASKMTGICAQEDESVRRGSSKGTNMADCVLQLA